MLSICTCLIMNGCSSKRNRQSCFLKKPLVAVSLLVIITMCLTLTEAAPRSVEHRRRHHRRQAESIPYRTKELSRHRNSSIEPYKTTIKNVITRLRNNKRFYMADLSKYKGVKQMGGVKGNPAWLPKVNFVVIHFKKSKNLTSRFKYIIPKLYKHIKEYRAIFELLLSNVIVNYSSNQYNIKKASRDEFLNSIITRLDLLITDITDGMHAVQMPIPAFHTNSLNLTDFNHIVDDTGLDHQDDFAFRGYENLLQSWRLELNCWKKNSSKKATCNCFNAQMLYRKEKKVPKRQWKIPECDTAIKRRTPKMRHHQERRWLLENS